MQPRFPSPVPVPLLLVALAIPLVGGCAATEKRQLAQQWIALTAAQDTLVALHGANVVNDATVLKAKPLVAAANDALTLAEQALQRGDGADFRTRLRNAKALIRGLISLYGGTPPDDGG